MSDPTCVCAPSTREATSQLVSGLIDDVVELKREVTQLRGALTGRVAVEQATGMLMLAYSYGPERAASILAEWATDFGVTPRAVAERMVAASDTAAPTAVDPQAAGRARLRAVRLPATGDAVT